MKTKFFTISSILAMSVLSAQAQITVTSNDLVFGVDTNLMKSVFVETSSMVMPTHGANQVWDYAGLDTIDYMESSFAASNNVSPFDSSTAMLENVEMLIGSFIVENMTAYYTQKATGFNYDGYSIPYQAFELNIPGDSLKISSQSVELGGNNPEVPFDLVYEGSDTFQAVETVNFILDYSILNNAPGYLKRTHIKAFDVVGHGQVIMPVTNDTIEALLVKNYRKTIDSIFVNNMPIAPSLLTGTGLEQGAVSENGMYMLVGKGYNSMLATISTDAAFTSIGNAEFLYVETEDVDTGTSVGNIAMKTIKAYPNPAHDELTLDIEANKNLVAEIYNVAGQLLSVQVVKNNKVQVASLSAGTYVVRVKEGTTLMGGLKFIKE